jgi:hypothetical protein
MGAVGSGALSLGDLGAEQSPLPAQSSELGAQILY